MAATRRAAAESKAAAASGQSATAARSWASAVKDAASRADGLIGTIQGVGGAFAAIGAAKAAYDLAQTGAAAQAARASFDSLAASAGSTGQALLSSLQAASKGAVSNADLIKSSNTALLLLGSSVATQLPQLLAIARASATTLGTDVGMVFDSLVTGIARGSTELIDNAGIVVKAGDAYASYAAGIGKSADALTGAEKQQAILNAVLTSGQSILNQTAGAAATSAESFQRFNASIANLVGELGGGLANALQPAIDKLTELAEAAREGAAATAEAGGVDAAAFMPALQAAYDGLSERARAFADAQTAAGASFGAAVAAGREYEGTAAAIVDIQGAMVAGWDGSAEAAAALAGRMTELASSSEANRLAVEALATGYTTGQITAVELAGSVAALEANQANQTAATQAATDATAAQAATTTVTTAALDDSALAAQAQAQALADATTAAFEATNAGLDLDAAARAAAQALLASGNAGAAAAGQLGNSTAPIDKLTAAYYRLLAAQSATGAASALGNVGAARGPGGKGTPAGSTGARAAAEEVRGRTPPPRGGGGGGGGGRAGGGGGAASAPRVSEAQQASARLAEIEAQTGNRLAEIAAQTGERLAALDAKAAEERARIAAQLQTTLASDAAQGLASNEANDIASVGVTDPKQLAQIAAREKAEAEAAQRTAAAQTRAREQIAAGNAESAAAEYDASKSAIAAREQLDQAYYEKQAELAGNPEAQAVLDTQYQEAVAAAETAAQVEQEIAAAKVAAKVQAAQDEKTAVIQAATEQSAEVVKKAQEQAEGVKGAAEAQRQATVDALGASGQAATDWAAATETAAGRVAAAYAAAARAAATLPALPTGGGAGASGGGGASAAAGGGTFMTSGPTTLTVGDNPGGMELVHVVPLSGKGTTRVGGGMARMAGGGSLLAGGSDSGVLRGADALLREVAGLASAGGDVTEQIDNYAGAVGALLDALDGLRSLSVSAAAPLSPIPLEVIQQAAQQANRVVGLLRAELVPLAEDEAEQIGRMLDASMAAIDLLAAQRDVSAITTGYRPPLDEAFARELAQEARRVMAILASQLIPISTAQAEQLARFRDAQSAGIDTLTQTADLGRQLTGYRPPINLVDVREIANEAVAVTRQFQALLVPATEQQVSDVDRYAALVGASVAGLTGVLNLRSQLAGVNRTPISQTLVTFLAEEAQRAAVTFRALLIPLSEQEAGDVARYGTAVEAGLRALSAVMEMRRGIVESTGAPLRQELITQLALDAQRTVATFRALLLPLSEQEADDVQRYADTVERTLGVFSAITELTAGAFDGYESPSDASIGRVATDARRIADAFARAAATMGGGAATSAKDLADATTSAVTAARESLLTMQAINDGTFALNTAKLAQFEASGMQLYDSLERLGARAVQIPAPNLAAVTAAAGAITAQSQALVALSAVPFDNLAALSGGFAGASGGGTSTTTTSITIAPGAIVIYPAAGMDAGALANQVISRINQQLGSRR